MNLTCTFSAGVTNTTCAVNPASVHPGGTATLTVTAGSVSANLRANPLLHLGWQFASGLVFAAGLLFSRIAPGTEAQKEPPWLPARPVHDLRLAWRSFLRRGWQQQQRQPATTSPQPQSGTVTVQATSGSPNHTVQISVTVN